MFSFLLFDIFYTFVHVLCSASFYNIFLWLHFFLGSAFVCIEISIHQETKREQNSLFATHSLPRILANLNIMSLPYLFVTMPSFSLSISRELFMYFEAFTFLALLVCVCAKNSSVKSCFPSLEATSPTEHTINRHRATIHVHILQKLKLVFYRFVAVRLPARSFFLFFFYSLSIGVFIVSLYFVFYFSSSFHAL